MRGKRILQLFSPCSHNGWILPAGNPLTQSAHWWWQSKFRILAPWCFCHFSAQMVFSVVTRDTGKDVVVNTRSALVLCSVNDQQLGSLGMYSGRNCRNSASREVTGASLERTRLFPNTTHFWCDILGKLNHKQVSWHCIPFSASLWHLCLCYIVFWFSDSQKNPQTSVILSFFHLIFLFPIVGE